jgi:PAS domain S-box-containing protein
MKAHNGFQVLKVFYSDSHTDIFLGKKPHQLTPLLLKVLNDVQRFPVIESQYHRDYNIRDSLKLSSVLSVSSIVYHGDKLILAMEDMGGIPLSSYLRKHSLSFKETLAIAIKMILCIKDVHGSNIIHSDIKPANFMYNDISKELKLSNFNLAITPLTRHSTDHANTMEGTLAYISPEKTGRIKKNVDFRSDFYSLGVTLYELFTGELPFQSIDPMGMVHSHIAKLPYPPNTIDASLPTPVSAIILKLMAKNPDDRYKSTAGILYDLQRCMDQYENRGSIRLFNLGDNDVSEHFYISTKLYGRELELQTLQEGFERVREGSKEVLLVTGNAGIGKSALVNEISKSLLQMRGIFLSGKFDQLTRSIVYSAIGNAFNGLVKDILSRPNEELKQWRENILLACGKHAKIITNIIPELEIIIGKQPDLEEIEPEQSRNRHNRVFRSFVRVIATFEHPLILFLDDLQWADSPSLKLVELLLSDHDLLYLYVICAYRENEIEPLHPLNNTLLNLRTSGVRIDYLKLNPLNKDHLAEFLKDTVPASEGNIRLLTGILDKKANGNPFFVKKILHTLYQEKLIRYVPDLKEWQWDEQELGQIDISDNVVEFLIRLLEKLPEETKHVLQLSASIGNQFDFKTLSMVSSLDTQMLQQHLISATREEILFIERTRFDSDSSISIESNLEEATFHFQHDRIQQAAYALIPEEIRTPTHLRIGRILWQRDDIEINQENILMIANHMNIAIQLVKNKEERFNLAQLNLQVGIHTKKSMAYQNATQYLNFALSLLPEKAWKYHPELTFDIHLEKAVSEYLNTNFGETKKLFDIIVNHTDNLFKLARIYDLMIVLQTNLGNMAKAVELGKKILAMFGMDIPDDNKALKRLVTKKIKTTKKRIEEISLANLASLPEMIHPQKIALMNLLVKSVPPSYQIQPDWCNLVIVTMVETSLEFGNSSHSAYGYDMFAILVGKEFADYQLSYRLGKVAMHLIDSTNDMSLKGAVYFVFSNFVSHWGAPLKTSLNIFKKGFDASLEAGDHIHTGYSASRFLVYSLFHGMPLEDICIESKHYVKFLLDKKDTTCSQMSLVVVQAMHMLRGTLNSQESLDGAQLKEQEFIRQFDDNLFSLSHFYVIKMMVHYLHSQWQLAKDAFFEAGKVMHGANGSTVTVEFLFYGCLIDIQQLEDAPIEHQKHLKSFLHAQLKQFLIWSRACPENYAHKYNLLKAELENLDGNLSGAADHFDLAIEQAQNHGFMNMEALAYERTARFWNNHKKNIIAKTYLEHALKLYRNWGAKTKIELLTQEFSHLLHYVPTKVNPAHINEQKNFDLMSVIKASQAISKEIDLNKLLEQFMKIILENAGAQKGCLLLPNQGELYIESSFNSLTGERSVHGSARLNDHEKLPNNIIYYVFRTGRQFLISNNQQGHDFLNDPFFKGSQPHSILCIPLQLIDKTIGVLYLENEHTEGVFSQDRVDVLNILISQVVISIENARMFDKILKSERALKQSEERFRTMIQHAPEAIVITDVHSGLFVEANENALKLFAMSREELVKTGPLDMSPETQPDGTISKQTIKGYIHKALQGEAVIFEWTHINAHQQLIPCEIRFTILPNKDHTLLRCSVIDISERKKIEEEKRRLLEQLLQSQKMKMIGQLTGGIAHDFNNLLTVIQGNLELIQVKNDDAAKVLKYSNRATSATTKAGVLIHRLLAYSRKQPLHPQTIAINSLLEGMKDLMERTLGETITIYITTNEEPWTCNIDPSQLENAILNLVVNSRDAMPSGGVISIESENITVSSQDSDLQDKVKPGQYISLSVIDNGSGIEPEVLEKVFEPYFTTKGVGKGSGLGLSMLYGFIKQSGGYVFIDSVLGEGTAINILLPRSSKDKSAHFSDEELPEELPLGNGELILVVEDEADLRYLSVDLLTELGYKTIDAENGAEALRKIKASKDLALIFSDVVLPGSINGLEVGQKAKELLPGIKVIFTSGYSEKLIKEKNHIDTPIEVLKKPFSKTQLAEFIHRAINM